MLSLFTNLFSYSLTSSSFVSFCTEDEDVQELALLQAETELVPKLDDAAENAKVNEGEYIHMLFPVLNSLYLPLLI